MAALLNSLYSMVFKRTSTFVVAVVGGAFVFERIFDQGADWIFETVNKGVSNLTLTDFRPKGTARFFDRQQVDMHVT